MKKKAGNLPDANTILRYLLKDVPQQFEEASAFFEDVRVGRIKAFILEGVFVECVYVLLKYYDIPRKVISQSLSGLLQYKGIMNQNKDILVEALRLFAAHNLDIVDCLLVSKGAREQMRIFSFDKEVIKLARKLESSAA